MVKTVFFIKWASVHMYSGKTVEIWSEIIWKSAGFACWLCSTTINPDIGGSIQTLRKAQVSLKTRQLLTVVELKSTQFGFLQLWPYSNLNNNKNDKPSGALPLREPVSTIGRAVEKLWGKESSGEPQVSTQVLSADQCDQCRPTLHALPPPREVTLFLLPNPQQRQIVLENGCRKGENHPARNCYN